LEAAADAFSSYSFQERFAVAVLNIASIDCADTTTDACSFPSGQAPRLIGDVLDDLRKVYGSGSQEWLNLVGLGGAGDFGRLGVERGERLRVAGSRCWASRTHSNPAKHTRDTRVGAARAEARRWRIGGLGREMRRLRLAGFPEPVDGETAAVGYGRALGWGI
jgi:hypothetical protein